MICNVRESSMKNIYIYIYIQTVHFATLCHVTLITWQDSDAISSETSFFAYWFPSCMAFGTVLEGFEKYGGWGEACTLPIDARTCILVDFN